MSVPARGTKRGRDNEIEKVCIIFRPSIAIFVGTAGLSAVREECILILTPNQEDSFYSRPSVRIVMPDNLKSLLVDDWENVTKNQQVVALPAKASVNQILDDYFNEEKPKRATSADLDVLEEVITGIREYFDKSLDKILLYRFEREQYRSLRSKWENGSGNFADKGPLDIYGAEHLTRLFGELLHLFHSGCCADCDQLRCQNSWHKRTWTSSPPTDYGKSSPSSQSG